MGGRKRIYDRIKIRGNPQYWKNIYDVLPPMSYDSSINLLTIYGIGIRYMEQRGMNIEESIEKLINHEILHDVIYQSVDLSKHDVFQQHWPFYCGIDYMNGDYFTTMLEKVKLETPFSSSFMNAMLEL